MTAARTTEARRRDRRPQSTVDAARVLRPDRPLLADVLATLVYSPQFAAPPVVADDLRAWCDGNPNSSLRFTDRSVAFVGDALEYPLCREMCDPACALETLVARGLLPAEAMDAAGRAFVRADEWPLSSAPPSLSATPRLAAHPPDLRALVAWASLGWPALRAAEEIAREVVARLRPWGAPQPSVVAWRVVDAATWAPEQTGPLADALRAAQRVVATIMSDLPAVAEVFRAEAPKWKGGTPAERYASALQFAVYARGWARKAAPHAMAEADPFAPLVSLWESGLALDAITPAAIVLVVPAP